VRTREISVGSVKIGGDNSLVLIAGPCVIESEQACREAAIGIKEAAERVGIPLIFKSSFDKANRTSVSSFRGPGLKAGLEILGKIKSDFKLPVLTDIHEPDQCEAAAKVVDCIQIPAFLCRQTDLLIAAGKTGCVVNVKKGQFLAPADMRNVVDKIKSTDNEDIILTERGTCFGYHYLVSDMRSLPAMRRIGFPVVFDATHSVQIPGGMEGKSGGERQYVAPLSRAAVAAGVDGVFMEAHPTPDKALSDGPNMMAIDHLPALLSVLMEIDKAVRKSMIAENVELRTDFSRGLTTSIPTKPKES
jgi:2-dehydro-3-deoxyphosphooctonate aldolase (KDO 8-P synthase)